MQKNAPQQVKEYYNKMTSSYLNIYGDVIQAFRPAETEKLLDYIGRNAGLNWNLNVLDLGCGVAGPAIYFAKKWNVNIDGVTISETQFHIAKTAVEREELQHKIHLFLGDYHQLEQLEMEDNYYDVVLFLESLGHSDNITSALQQASVKLKPGGFLYIKDFYKKHALNIEEQKRIDKVIENINAYYSYNTLDFYEVKTAIENAGMKIIMNKNFDFIDDINIRFQFEKENSIDIFENQPEFYPADWLEIKCVKC